MPQEPTKTEPTTTPRSANGCDTSDAEGRGDLEQVHVWLRKDDARLLRTLATQREQTLSGAVRFLLKPFRATLTRT